MNLGAEALQEAAGPWAPEIRYFEECDSTNRLAREWADEGAAEGSLVVTGHQTAGRGRLGRSWFSVPGGLLQFSVILRPELAADHLALVSLVAAAALAISLRSKGVTAVVKWPNDVLVDGKKVSGMLSEAGGGALVLGIGINVNVAASDFPAELARSATSLLISTGHRSDRPAVLAAFLSEFGPQYAGLTASRAKQALDYYRPLCETLGREVRIETSSGEVAGIATDVDSTGALVIDGAMVVTTGDVVHLR